MKIGVCTSMNPLASRSSNFTGIEYIEFYRRAGFDYVELPAAPLMNRPEKERRRLEEEALSHGLPCRAVNTLFPASLRVTGDNTDRAAIDDYIDGVCAMTARLGATYIVFGSGGARNVPMNFPKAKAAEQVADTMNRLADRAAKDNLFVAVEHLNRQEGNIVETFREGIELSEKLNHPHIRGFVDYYHLGVGNEGFDLLRTKIPSIEHAHYANLVGRTVPTGNRHEDEGLAFLELMKERGYEGGISVEGFAKDMDEFPDCAAFLKRFA